MKASIEHNRRFAEVTADVSSYCLARSRQTSGLYPNISKSTLSAGDMHYQIDLFSIHHYHHYLQRSCSFRTVATSSSEKYCRARSWVLPPLLLCEAKVQYSLQPAYHIYQLFYPTYMMRESHICHLPNKVLILCKSLSFCNEVIWSIAIGASTGVDKGFEGQISRLQI